MSSHKQLNNVNISECSQRINSFCFCSLHRHTSLPHIKTEGRLAPHSTSQSTSAPTSSCPLLPAGFSHVHIASPWLCHVAVCWYYTTAPACCLPCFHITQRVQRHCPWYRMQGLPWTCCVLKNGNCIFSQNRLEIVRNCVSCFFGRTNILSTSTWNHNRLYGNLKSDTSHNWAYCHVNIPPSDSQKYVDNISAPQL